MPFKACWNEYKALNHGSLQATVKRVDFAFVRFFKGLGGYPRFQGIRRPQLIMIAPGAVDDSGMQALADYFG